MKTTSEFLSYRTYVLIGLTLLALVISLLTDPDSGLSTALGALAILQGVWAVAAMHISRKAILYYPEADMRTLFAKALKTSTGAGLALIAISIFMVGLLMVFAPRAQADTLPAGFALYGPTLKAEQEHYWPDHPNPAVLASLVEQESCISLTHSKCWNPAARLKTAREEGAGVGQITRAYRADGTLRFDSLAGLVDQYGTDLDGLSWDTVYTRPDLQLRALVLMSRDAARPFRLAQAMLEFADAGYNGGLSGVKKERRACQLVDGCDPAYWFGHVELHCLKSRQPLYGTRSACDINRTHVENVLRVRLAKYEAVW